MRLVLASTSPRRKELLALLGIPFEIAAPTGSEELERPLSPPARARRFAEGKARSCRAHVPDALVLASDTLIAINDLVLGKPRDREDARGMLHRLQGREHVIHTAVAVVRETEGICRVAGESVRVQMRAMSPADVESYLDTEEWTGKAGAYAIQGAGGPLIQGIRGDFTAVVGLPLRLTAHLLHTCGLSIPVDIERLYRQKPYPNWARFSTGSQG